MIYLKSANSADSTWMPWELGYFDGFRGRVGILPIMQDKRDDYRGSEYLGLYPYVDIATLKNADDEVLWINRSSSEYGPLREWIKNPDVIMKRA